MKQKKRAAKLAGRIKDFKEKLLPLCNTGTYHKHTFRCPGSNKK